MVSNRNWMVTQRSRKDSVIFATMKNAILTESPTLRLFKAIERSNLDGVKQALSSGALCTPGWDENALNSRIENIIRHQRGCG